MTLLKIIANWICVYTYRILIYCVYIDRYLCSYLISRAFGLTGVRSPQNGLFPMNLQIDLIGNSSCQLICGFQGEQNLTSARAWHCRLCHRALVTTLTRTQHPQFTQVVYSQISICKMTYVTWTYIPYDFLPSLMPGVLLDSESSI